MKRAISVSVKIKKDIEYWTVKWQPKPNGEEMSCKSCEFPRPELPATLDAFAEFVPDIIMIPKENMVWCEIAGATFEYDKAGRVFLSLGVAVGFRNKFDIKFTSPDLAVDFEQNINEAEHWREKYSALAKMLHDEIIMYAEGTRAQTELDFERENENELVKEVEASDAERKGH